MTRGQLRPSCTSRLGLRWLAVSLLLLALPVPVLAQPSDPTRPILAERAGAVSGGSGSQAAAADDGDDWRQILPGLTIGSQLRFRTETRRSFRFDDALAGNDEDFVLSRFRFDVAWEASEQVSAVVAVQDARIFGETAINENRAPNIFADELDVHQAYLDFRSSSSAPIPFTVRVGRQKIAYGTQRRVSPLEGVNTARVFDGVKLGLGAGTGRILDGFATRLVPVAPRDFNDHAATPNRMFNSQFHGFYYSDSRLVSGSTIEAFWLLRRETRVDDEVHTVGARVDATVGAWSFDGEVARQVGTYGGEEQRATMVHVGGSFTTALPGRPRLGAAFNVGDGDDDPDDGVHRTFDNLYPLNHAYYGSMDFFALQNLRNIEVSVDAALPRGTVRVAYQHFALLEPGTDAWYNAGGGSVHAATAPGVSSNVGGELDVTLRVPVWEMGLEAGYGHFFGGDYLKQEGFPTRSADFLYLQMLTGF